MNLIIWRERERERLRILKSKFLGQGWDSFLKVTGDAANVCIM